jgi:alkanesulfonate monooxygenase SsuD/methylene tetrahydromethanopterin reductase-like flavin-dependent oxidoreductase (luciferase family)
VPGVRPPGDVPRLGIVLPEGEGDMGGRTARWTDYAAMARTAEAMGFDSIWFPDHLLYLEDATTTPPQGAWECWSMLAGLAAITERVELAPLVTATGYRNPALLAKIADAVDEISGGRLVLALGAGWQDPEYRAFGFPADHKVGRFEEALTIIHGLLRNGAIDHEGTYYQVRDCELRPRGPRAGGIPILVGANGPRMLRLTARFADRWNTWLASGSSSIDEFRPDDAALDAACVEAGRDPATVERSVSVLVDPVGGTPIPASMSPATARPISGPPAVIAGAIRAFGSLGVGHIQLYPLPNTVDGIRRLEPVLRELDRR